MAKTLRLFYAIPVPDDVRYELRKAADSLGPDWRPSTEAQLHITLAFMGEVPEEDLSAVIAAGDHVIARIAPFSVKLGDAGGFPNDSSPRVWFIHVESPELMQLAETLIPRVASWADRKPFKAHLTIARPRSHHATGRPLKIDRSWRVDRFELVRSTLGADGASHTVVQEFRLTG